MLKATEVHISRTYRRESIITNHQLGMQKTFLIKVNPDTRVRDLTDEEVAAAPDGHDDPAGVGATKAYKFRIQISPLDCTGCSNCADVCPAPTKALVMKPLESQLDQEKYWDYLTKHVGYKDTVVDKTKTVKNSQFAQPLFEFSGACAGCGETPSSN